MKSIYSKNEPSASTTRNSSNRNEHGSPVDSAADEVDIDLSKIRFSNGNLVLFQNEEHWFRKASPETEMQEI